MIRFFVVALAALVLGACATHSQSSGTLKIDTTSHEVLAAHADERSVATQANAAHSEDRGTEKTDEAISTVTDGGAFDFVGTITKPDGTKMRGHLHRAPVRVKRDERKTAAVQKSLSADASSLLAAQADTHVASSTTTDTTGHAAGSFSKEHDGHFQAFSCAAGGTAGFLLLGALVFFLWRRLRSTKIGKLAEDVAAVAKDVVSPLP